MARILRPLRLGHQPSVGDPVREVELAAGDEVTVLHEWRDSLLIKDAAGRLFHAPKDAVER